MSIVLTTHHLEEAQERCERVLIIDHGRIVAAGTVPELVAGTLGRARTLRVTVSAPIAGARPARRRDAVGRWARAQHGGRRRGARRTGGGPGGRPWPPAPASRSRTSRSAARRCRTSSSPSRDGSSANDRHHRAHRLDQSQARSRRAGADVRSADPVLLDLRRRLRQSGQPDAAGLGRGRRRGPERLFEEAGRRARGRGRAAGEHDRRRRDASP